jgi:hypothetical protein
VAVVVQIMAILLLQFYQLAPHLSHKPIQPQCRGNHAQCGCSPEKIVSRTCCCYHHKPTCCDKDQHHDEESIAQKEKNPPSRYLSAAPCGSSPKFITLSLDKLKFLRTEALPLTPTAYSQSFPSPDRETGHNRFTEPLVPPPKPVFLS